MLARPLKWTEPESIGNGTAERLWRQSIKLSTTRGPWARVSGGVNGAIDADEQEQRAGEKWYRLMHQLMIEGLHLSLTTSWVPTEYLPFQLSMCRCVRLKISLVGPATGGIEICSADDDAGQDWFSMFTSGPLKKCSGAASVSRQSTRLGHLKSICIDL